MSEVKPIEYWIDSLPIFNSDNSLSLRRAFTTKADALKRHKGNEIYHVIEYSAYEKLQERVKRLERLEKLEIEKATCCMDNEEKVKQLEQVIKANARHTHELEYKNKILIEAFKLVAFKSEFVASYQEELNLTRKQAREALKAVGVE